MDEQEIALAEARKVAILGWGVALRYRMKMAGEQDIEKAWPEFVDALIMEKGIPAFAFPSWLMDAMKEVLAA